jgi:hypothetical protein
MRMDDSWAAVLVVAMAAVLAGGAWLLGKRTWFS